MFDPAFHVRLLGPADAALLAQADPEVFDRPVDARWAAEFLGDPRHHIAVAMTEGRIVGAATATHYVHPDKPPTLFVIEVGVAHPHQRRGMAHAMLQALFAHGRTLGCTSAWVGTERGNVAARALYARAGGLLDSDEFVTYSFDLEGDSDGDGDHAGDTGGAGARSAP